MNKKGLSSTETILYGFIALAAIGIAAFFASKYIGKSKVTTSTSPTVTPTFTSNNVPVNVWVDYTNKKYYYSISIPPSFIKQDRGSQTEEYIEFVKTAGDSVSKIRILMTSSKIQRDEIAKIKSLLKDVKMDEIIKKDSINYSKIYVSNFTAYKVEVENSSYTATLYIEKNKWIYQFNFEASSPDDRNILAESISKIKIFDSEAELNVENPQ